MLADFGVLRGKVRQGEEERHDAWSPHFQLTVLAANHQWRVPVNIKSTKEPYNILFHVENDFHHPILEDLMELPEGFFRKKEMSQLGIDYLRSELFDLKKLKPVPFDQPGDLNDLFDFFSLLVGKARRENAEIYVFGDKIEGKEMLHDVHMNQGNDGYFEKFNGSFQDGALFFRFNHSWAGVFLAFQTQSIPTDRDGSPFPFSRPVLQADLCLSQPVAQVGEGDIILFGALVNPQGKDFGAEVVYLFNRSSTTVSLDGWKIEDRDGRILCLDNFTIEGQNICVLPLDGKGLQLPNKGGVLSLITPRGIKCHGVSYTAAEVQKGKVLVFNNI